MTGIKVHLHGLTTYMMGQNRNIEHKILPKLLTGKDVSEMFDKNVEYIDNEKL